MNKLVYILLFFVSLHSSIKAQKQIEYAKFDSILKKSDYVVEGCLEYYWWEKTKMLQGIIYDYFKVIVKTSFYNQRLDILRDFDLKANDTIIFSSVILDSIIKKKGLLTNSKNNCYTFLLKQKKCAGTKILFELSDCFSNSVYDEDVTEEIRDHITSNYFVKYHDEFKKEIQPTILTDTFKCTKSMAMEIAEKKKWFYKDSYNWFVTILPDGDTKCWIVTSSKYTRIRTCSRVIIINAQTGRIVSKKRFSKLNKVRLHV